jgi:hypothetical protein
VLFKYTGPGHIDLVYSPDDGGWYAMEFDNVRAKVRCSKRIYRRRENLVRALRSQSHSWEKWTS